MEEALRLLTEMTDQFENTVNPQSTNNENDQNDETESKEQLDDNQTDALTNDDPDEGLQELVRAGPARTASGAIRHNTQIFYSASKPTASQSKEEKLYFRFIQSIVQSNADNFNKILNQIDDVDVPKLTSGKRGWPPILHAVHKNRIEFVRKLIARGADLNVTFPGDGRSLLHKTVAAGKSHPMVQLLLSHNLDVNQVDNSGETPLWTACKNGYDDIVELLLNGKQVCNVNVQKDPQSTSAKEVGQTALFICADKGFVKPAKLLLNYDRMTCDINIPDSHHRTPLLKACTKGHKEMVQLLLEHNADVNILNWVNRNALGEAYSIGKNRICNMLLDHYGKEIELWRPDKDGSCISDLKHKKIDKQLTVRIQEALHVYVVNALGYCTDVADSSVMESNVLVMIAKWTY